MNNSLFHLLSFILCTNLPVLAESVRTAEAEQIVREGIWHCLRDLHGEATDIVSFADRMEKEQGISKSVFSDLIFEVANDEHEDRFARKNAVLSFFRIAPPKDLDKGSEFFENSNSELRTAAFRAALVRLPDISTRIRFARSRLEWLQDHPEFQHDAFHIMLAFYNQMTASDVSDEDKAMIVSFFRDEAKDCRFGENAYSVFSFLNRHDPSWRTNECRGELLRRWSNDPNLPEDVRSVMCAAITNSSVSSRETNDGSGRAEENFAHLAESVAISGGAVPSAIAVPPDREHQRVAHLSPLGWVACVTAFFAAPLGLALVKRRPRVKANDHHPSSE